MVVGKLYQQLIITLVLAIGQLRVGLMVIVGQLFLLINIFWIGQLVVVQEFQ